MEFKLYSIKYFAVSLLHSTETILCWCYHNYDTRNDWNYTISPIITFQGIRLKKQEAVR